jgi:hypothetical protein
MARVRETLARCGGGDAPVFLHVDPGTPDGAVVQLRRGGILLEEPALASLVAQLGPDSVRLAPAESGPPRSRQLFPGAPARAPAEAVAREPR